MNQEVYGYSNVVLEKCTPNSHICWLCSNTVLYIHKPMDLMCTYVVYIKRLASQQRYLKSALSFEICTRSKTCHRRRDCFNTIIHQVLMVY